MVVVEGRGALSAQTAQFSKTTVTAAVAAAVLVMVEVDRRP